jgi:hypothetical protein
MKDKSNLDLLFSVKPMTDKYVLIIRENLEINIPELPLAEALSSFLF